MRNKQTKNSRPAWCSPIKNEIAALVFPIMPYFVFFFSGGGGGGRGGNKSCIYVPWNLNLCYDSESFLLGKKMYT